NPWRPWLRVAEKRPGLSLGIYLAFGLRNLWRNPRRTLLSLLSLVLGTGVVTFLGAVNDGWLKEMQENFILTYTGHVQIHARNHLDTRRITDYVRRPSEIKDILEKTPEVAHWTRRIEVPGLASVGAASTGVQILGVEHLGEHRVSRLHRLISAGRCLDGTGPNQLVLGQDVAVTLNAVPGTQVILTSEGPDGQITSELFSVCGVIRSGAPQLDRVLAIIPLPTAQRWLGLGSGVTQFVISAHAHEQVEKLEQQLRAALAADTYETVSWAEIDPMVSQWLRFGEVYGLLVLGIVVALTTAQVGNTMTMALYERVREFGLMEALGTRSVQVFTMVAWETVLLVLIGGALGYAAGAVAAGLSSQGIDFSAFSSAFEFFFMEPVITPVLTREMALKVLASLFLALVLGAIYPAWKASRLNPVEAMHWR
ncbi:MAG: ABC transporter permease, partial [Pseudomonadota bacterium]